MQNLRNIIDEIVPDEEATFFNTEEALELYQTCVWVMEEFIRNNPKIITEADFEEIFNDNMDELMKSHFDDDIFYTEDAEEELDEIMEQAKTDFFKDFMPIRSYPSSVILKEPNYGYITPQIEILRKKPQPTQRTKEWYEFRHNLITASNAYKAFDSQCNKNQLIYEKCQPLNPENYIASNNPLQHINVDALFMASDINVSNSVNNNIKQIQINPLLKQQSQQQSVNINSTLHWGQKYEPLSVLIYEDMFQTTIEDFGCIQHDKYAFLGASPDGINVSNDSPRYGRMLEIKNIVNREIDGIPKQEYWVQMQLQMEVCGLNECDFLETKFVECEETEYLLLNDSKRKGVILYFHATDGKPFYKYMPFHIKSPCDVDYWQEQMIELYQSAEYKYIWIKTYFWKLEILSCVLVCRNRQWFNDNIAEMAELWSIILKERVSGYEHRAPNRKPKPENAFTVLTKPPAKCLLQFVVKKEPINTNVNVNTNVISNIREPGKCLLKFIKKEPVIMEVKDLQLII
jgi:hypothetical protein